MTDTFSVFIEIPQGSSIKYEWSETLNRLVIDRVLPTAMTFPISYGYLIGTQGGDGDPLDAMVFLSQTPEPGSVIACRVIGALDMEDEKGPDPKIVCVPLSQIDPEYRDYQNLDSLSQAKKSQLSHFFAHYKDLDQGKWVKVKSWKTPDEAIQLINSAT